MPRSKDFKVGLTFESDADLTVKQLKALNATLRVLTKQIGVLAEANKDMAQFQKTLQAVDEAPITKLNDELGKLGDNNPAPNLDKASAALEKLDKELQDAEDAIDGADSALMKAAKDASKAAKGYNANAGAVDKMGNAHNQAAGPIGGIVGKLKSVGNALKESAARWKEVGSSIAIHMAVANQALEFLGKGLAFAKRAFSATVGKFAEFETALTGVAKTTDLSADGVQNFGKRMGEISTEIPVSSRELLKFAELAGQLGVKGSANLENFAVTIAKVARATNLTGEQAAQSFAQILNVTNESISGVDEFASIVVKLGNNFETTEKAIVRSTNEIARGTASFGVSSTEAAALATVLSSLGIQAEISGSTLGTSFATINKIIQGGGKELTKFSKFIGMTGDDLKKEFEQDAVGVFQKFAVAIKNSGANAQIALEEFGLSGQGVNKVLIPLASRTDKLTQALAMARDELEKNTALNEEADRAFKTLAATMTKMGNAFDGVMSGIGAQLAPAFNALFLAITEVLKVAKVFVDLPWKEAAETVPIMLAIAGSVAVLASAVGLANPAIGIFAAKLAIVGVEALLTAAKMIPVVAKMVLMAVGVGTLVTALDFLIRNLGRTGEVFTVFGKIVEASFRNMRGVVQTIKGEFLFSFAEMILSGKQFSEGISKAIRFVLKGLEKLARAVGQIDLAEGLKSAAKGVEATLNKQFDDVAKIMRDKSLRASKNAEFSFLKADQLRGEIKDITSTMDKGIAGKLVPLFDKLANGISETGEATNQTGKAGAKAVKEMAGELDKATTATEKLSDAQKQLEDVMKMNGQLAQQIAEFGKSEIAVINMRTAARTKELGALSQALAAEGKLTGGAQAAISLAEQQQRQLDLLKIGKMRADAAKEFAGVSKDLAKQIESFGRSELSLIKTRTAERLKELQAIKDKLGAEGKLGGGAGPAIDTAMQQTADLARLQIAEKRRDVEKDLVKAAQAAITANQQANDVGVQAILNKRDAERQVLAEKLKGMVVDGTATTGAVKLVNLLGKAANRAAQIEITNLRADSLKAVTSEVQAMEAAMGGDGFFNIEIPILSAIDAIEEKAALEMEAIARQEEELASQGLLTAEMQKQLDKKRELVSIKAGDEKQGALLEGASKVGGAIKDGFVAGVKGLNKAINFMASLNDDAAAKMIEGFEKLPQQLAEGMKNLPKIFKSFVENFLKALDTMVSALPQMISELFSMLPQLIDKIFASMAKLFDALPAIFSQILDSLVPIMVKIMEKLPDMILGMLDSIGDMAVILISKIPEIIVKFAENIGPIVEALVDGLVSNIGKIVIGLIDTFIVKGGAVKIGLAIAKAMIITLPIALVKGLAKGLEKIWKALFSGSKINLEMPKALEEMPQKLGKELDKVVAGVKASSSNVFAVVDLEQVKAAKTIDKSIGQATKRAAAAFKNTFKTIGGWLKKLWAALKAIWDTVIMWLQKLWAIIEQIWDVVVKALQALWDVIEAIWDVVVLALQALWDALEAIWDVVVLALQGLWDAIEAIWDAVVLALQGLWDAIEGIWNAVWEAFEKYISWLSETFDKLWKFISEGAEKLLGVITSIPGKIAEGVSNFANVLASIPGKIAEGVGHLWGALNAIPGKLAEGANGVLSKFGEIGGKVFEQLKSAFDKLNPANVLSKMFKFDGGGKGTVENLLNIDVPFVSFAQGGLVPGNAMLPGDNKKNDTVAALLSPGEAVIPRTALADPEIARLVQSIIDGDVRFAFKGLKGPKISVKAPALPKLPSANDLKKLSPADLIKSVQENLAQLSKMAFGDLWDMFKDKVFDQTRNGLEKMIRSAASFDNGGVVPADGVGMLHQNEVVLPTNVIDKIMSGGRDKETSKAGGTVINLNANITVGSGDKGQGKAVIDEMFKELRKRSANQKIMFQSGLIK